MRWLKAILCAALLGAAQTAWGDSFSSQNVPQDTRWVIHLDVDTARLTPLWELARQRLLAQHQDEILPRLTVIERITGLKLPQGLHDVTLYGSAFDEADVCIRIHGELDEALTTSFLKRDPEYREEPHEGHTILTWRDKGRDRLMYGAFADKDIVFISASPKVIGAALDRHGGKLPPLKPGSALAPPSGAEALLNGPPMLWVAADGLSDLQRMQKVESPALTQMDAASVGLRWGGTAVGGGGQAQADIRVMAREEKAAQQMQALAEGMKAMIALQAADEHATPRCRVLSAALQELTVSVEGKTVKGRWVLGRDQIENLVKIATQEGGGGAATGVAAPAQTIPK